MYKSFYALVAFYIAMYCGMVSGMNVDEFVKEPDKTVMSSAVSAKSLKAETKLKDLGAEAFGYGYPVPVLMVATYNEDGTVNVMNMHEAMRTNAGDLALCIGPRSKTHRNVEMRRAFTVALVDRNLMAEVDYLGTVSGFRVPDKVESSHLSAIKSKLVDAPIIKGSRVVIECRLIEIVEGRNFSTVLARIMNVAADESVLNESGRIDAMKTGMLLYDPFGTNYITLGEIVGKPWHEGRKFMKK